MNWLQRNLPSRESWAWAIVTLAGAAGYLTMHFELLQGALALDPIWEKRIELASGLLTFLAAKNSYSWMPSREKQGQAIDDHNRKRIEKLDAEIDEAGDDSEPPPTV